MQICHFDGRIYQRDLESRPRKVPYRPRFPHEKWKPAEDLEWNQLNYSQRGGVIGCKSCNVLDMDDILPYIIFPFLVAVAFCAFCAFCCLCVRAIRRRRNADLVAVCYLCRRRVKRALFTRHRMDCMVANKSVYDQRKETEV